MKNLSNKLKLVFIASTFNILHFIREKYIKYYFTFKLLVSYFLLIHGTYIYEVKCWVTKKILQANSALWTEVKKKSNVFNSNWLGHKSRNLLIGNKTPAFSILIKFCL